jgi:hypothetical protein
MHVRRGEAALFAGQRCLFLAGSVLPRLGPLRPACITTLCGQCDRATGSASCLCMRQNMWLSNILLSKCRPLCYSLAYHGCLIDVASPSIPRLFH